MRSFLLIFFICLFFTAANAVVAQDAGADAAPEKIMAVGPFVTDVLQNIKLKEGREGIAVPLDQIKNKNATYLSNIILKERPTFVLIDEALADKRLVAALEKKTAVFVALEKAKAEEVVGVINGIGKFIGEEKSAKQVSGKLQRINKALQLKLGTVPAEVDMIYLPSIDGRGAILISGYNTAAEKIIQMAGGYSIVEQFSGQQPLTIERAAALHPKKILVSKEALEAFGGRDGLIANPIVASMGIGVDQIIEVDGKNMEAFGPSGAKQAVAIARELFPEVDFSDVASK